MNAWVRPGKCNDFIGNPHFALGEITVEFIRKPNGQVFFLTRSSLYGLSIMMLKILLLYFMRENQGILVDICQLFMFF
jgi:hypothetical protein